MVTALHHCSAQWNLDGAAIIATKDERYIPAARSINHITGILTLSRARQQGAIESIFFALIGNKLATPGTSILPGIARQVLLSMAKVDDLIVSGDEPRGRTRCAMELFSAFTARFLQEEK